MATKSSIQRTWDRIRGKRGSGAVVRFDALGAAPNHHGAQYIHDGEEANRMFRDFVESARPGFISRMGTVELYIVGEFLNSLQKSTPEPRPAYTEKRRGNMRINAGFFTPTDELLTRFACETLRMTRDADIYCAFRQLKAEEILCRDYLPATSRTCTFAPMYPFYFENPWTAALADKKVLVVHPFAATIEKQYREKRELLFANPKVLPRFELSTLRAVQTSANGRCDFPDWFAALDSMKSAMDTVDFDIALIGAGAYGFFLAHHCKMIGKKGIQLGSAAQQLFGIKGKRWIDKNGNAPAYMNEHWTFPSEDERPPNPELVEGGCYW